MAETLTRDTALALLGNTLPTGAILVVLITILGPISGAHFNPAVTMVFAVKREMSARDGVWYVGAQIVGGILGTIVAHAMFALPLLEASAKVRTSGGQWLAEGVATFGLVATILAGIRFSAPRSRGWSASTSRPPIGSQPRRHSLILQWRFPAHSQTHFPASARSTFRASSSRSFAAP